MANEVAKTAPGGTPRNPNNLRERSCRLARLECNIYNDFREDGVKNDATGPSQDPDSQR